MTCRTIAVANQKGGTAKTATALSLGVALARTGDRVLLVDADPQGDLTKSLGWRDPDSLETTLATHLSAAREGSDDDPAAGMLRHREGVDLMPSNIELAAMEMAVFMAMSRERMMGAWLAPIKSDYDYVIVDCAPTLGIIPINALAAADSVLIPVSAEYLPASGMTGLLKTVARVRRQINPGLCGRHPRHALRLPQQPRQGRGAHRQRPVREGVPRLRDRGAPRRFRRGGGRCG